MFDSLYPEASDAALETKARRAPDAPAPTPWFKDFWSATGKAVPRAGAEMGRALTAPMTGEAAAALSAPSMFGAPQTTPTEATAQLREQDAAIRDAIKEMTPDANSTGAASMIMHDVTRFVGKAAAYSALGGTPGAIVGMAADEGTNEALRRMDEGVDGATAAKLGVVKGISSGVAVALPVAGKGIAQTIGLAAVGGPGSFIAEQATAREILRAADYTKEAAQIDPFDPMGLGVSFFGSALFGAGAHVARGVKARSNASVADAKLMAEPTPPSEQTKVAQAVERAYTPEQVDAAHVTILQAQREASALHAREDVAATGRHVEALDRAAEQMAAGRRVEVADVAPVDAARMQADVLPMVQRAVQVLNEVTASHSGQMDATMRAVVDGREAGYLDYTVYEGRPQIAMVEVAEEFRRQGIGAELVRELQRKFPDTEIDWGMLTAEGAALREALPKITQEVASVRAKVQELEAAVAERADLERQAEAFHEAPATEESRAAYREFIQKNGDRWNELHDRIDQLDNEVRGEALTKTLVDTMAPAKTKAEVRSPEAQPLPVKQESGAVKQEEGAGAEQPAADYAAREADAIATADPDMLVMMEGMEQPVKVSELLAEAKALAAQEIADAPLMKVAAECALRG